MPARIRNKRRLPLGNLLLLPLTFATLSIAFAAHADVLQGKVVGPDGAPVAGATVVVQTSKSWMGEIPAGVTTLTTGADGSFTTPDLPAGKPLIGVDSKVLPTWYGSVAVYAPGYAITGKILTKDATKNVVKLEKAGTVHGIVVDAAGKPIADVPVRVDYFDDQGGGDSGNPESVLKQHFVFTRNVEALQKMLVVKSGADGRFTILGLPTHGRGYCMLQEDAYVHQAVTLPMKEGDSGPDAAKLVVKPAARLTGRVIYADSGKPAEKVNIIAQQTAEGSDGWEAGGYSSGQSGADGTFNLGGLSAGKYVISVSGGEGKPDAPFAYVALPQSDITATLGKATPVPDLKLIAGVPVQITVTETETGQPVANAFISFTGPDLPPGRDSYRSYPTDKDGHVTFVVAPGKNTIALNGAPEGYLPESSEGKKVITAQVGDKPTVAFTLTRGLTTEGVVVGEDGKPIAGVHVRVLGAEDSDYEYNYPGMVRPVSDAQGKWSINGLRKEEKGYRVAVDSGWKVVSPDKPFTLPVSGTTMVVTLKKVVGLQLAGRILNTSGAPIPDMQLDGYARVPGDQQDRSTRNFTLKTDKNGAFVATDLRPEEKVTLSAGNNDGYKYVSGGVLTKTDTTASITDFVLAPLTNIISGRVIDSTNKPVAGAQVWSLNGDRKAHAVTDATGAFTLTRVPAGDVTVSAASGRRYGSVQGTSTASGKTGAVPVVVTLDSAATVPTPDKDLARARALMEETAQLMQAAKANVPRSGLPEFASFFDPDLALKYGAGADGRVVDGVRASIIEAVIHRTPARAADWGIAQLALIETALVRCRIEGELGLALAKINPTLAARMYTEGLKDGGNGNAVGINRARLVALAMMLQNGDAAQQLGLLKTALEDPKNKGYRIRCALLVARADPMQAEKLLDSASDEDRLGFYDGMIPVLIKTSPLRAKDYLEKFRTAANAKGINDYWRAYSLPQLTATVVKALAPSDPVVALALARSLPDGQEKAWSLAAAAPYQSKAEIAAVWKEAMNQISTQQWGIEPSLARLAVLASGSAPELSHQFWQQAKEAMERNDSITGSPEAFAFYATAFDPALARMVAERSYDSYGNYPAGNQSAYQMEQVVFALAALDADRAQELLAKIPADLDSSMALLDTRLGMSHLLAVPPSKRMKYSFEDLQSASPGDL